MLLLGRIVAALLSGALLAQAFSLNPFWPLAWLAPIPLLIAVIGASRLGAFAYGAIAGVVSMALMVSYFMDIGGLVPLIVVTLTKAIVWGAVAYAVRAAARVLPSIAAVFVFPALMAGIDTLIAATSPHGSAGALAYSQMDFLPAIQVASLGGAPAITFIVTLFASAIAFLVAKRAILATAAGAALVAAALGYGAVRPTLEGAGVASESVIPITLIAGDQFEGVPDDWRAVWNGYAPQIERAADQQRRVVLLPEKIAHLAPGDRAAAIEQLAEIARRRNILLVAGADDESEQLRFNRAFVFTPEGWQSYDKRHMIPGLESEFDLGDGPYTFEFDGVRYGVAICKDMDFPALGREYAGVSIILVPAWDFTVDAWFHGRMAMLRGVENGYTIVRSARNGRLTVSDRYGAVTYEAPSGPQTAYNVEARRSAPQPTLYSKIGDVFGWSMLALAALLIGWTIRNRKRASD